MKKLLFILPIFLLFIFVTPNIADAATCSLKSASFRSATMNSTNFFAESNAPFVYLDIKTKNCEGEIFNIDVFEFGSPPEFNIPAMNNKNFEVAQGVPDFSIVLRAGEDGCSANSSGDNCKYRIRTLNENSGTSIGSNVLKYDCNGNCNDSVWQYVNTVLFGASHPSDLIGGDNDEEDDPVLDDGDLSLPQINNPLDGKDINGIPEFIAKILDILVTIGIPIVTLAIIFSGFLFVKAQGNPEELTKAKKAFVSTAIGATVVLSAWLIAQILANTVGELLAYIVKTLV
jgi:hypothetical protein